jgi:hypothetical protein
MTSFDRTVVIEQISFYPDRFGRLHPSVFATTDSPIEPDIDVEFLDIDRFLKSGYREGDQVAVQYVGKIPMLGAIVKPAMITPETSSDFEDHLHLIRMQKCPGCFYPLIQRHMGLYCDNTTCSLKNINRVAYACQRNVLDLPIPRSDVYHWYSSLTEDISAPVTRFLSSEKQDILHMVEDEDEINHILDVFKTRRIQLEGAAYPDHVQIRARNCFLDALSLSGLNNKNRVCLVDKSMQNRWHWIDLPSVLTNVQDLLNLGISRSDAMDIVNSAQTNIDEITSFAFL